MFGCVIAGRPLQTNLQQVDETHALFELPNATSINHVSVFLLGTVPFPDGYGATVHFYWPGKGFQLLGMLSNDKPSAIFRLRGTFTSATGTTSTQDKFSMDTSSSAPNDEVTAILGLSVEPLHLILPQLSSASSSVTNSTAATTMTTAVARTMDPTLLAERIVKHLFNYIGGFIDSGGMGAAIAADTAIPMSIIARWYENFVSKIRAGGTGFLERED